MMARVFPFIWLIAFAAAMMLFSGYEAHSVLFAVSILAVSLAFVILKADLPQQFAPICLVFLLPIFAFWDLTGWSVLFSEMPYLSFIYMGFFSVLPLTICC